MNSALGNCLWCVLLIDEYLQQLGLDAFLFWGGNHLVSRKINV